MSIILKHGKIRDGSRQARSCGGAEGGHGPPARTPRFFVFLLSAPLGPPTQSWPPSRPPSKVLAPTLGPPLGPPLNIGLPARPPLGPPLGPPLSLAPPARPP